MHFLVRSYALCTQPGTCICIAFRAAECGVHAAALGVHPGTYRMPMYWPARWHARRSGRTVSCTLCPVHSSRPCNFVEFWTVLSRFRQRARHVHAGVHACTPKLAYTLACILYLADLHARIVSACICAACIHVELMFVKYKLLRLNYHKHYECTSSGSEESIFNCTDKKYQTTYSH